MDNSKSETLEYRGTKFVYYNLLEIMDGKERKGMEKLEYYEENGG